MSRSTIVYLLLVSSVLLGLYSCRVIRVNPDRIPNDCETMINTRISTTTYHTQIDFFGRHLSGLLVFKATADTIERVIFMTETGFKFFDFEFTPGTFTVKYCLAAMNKKIIVKTLRRDLGFLVDFKHKQMGIRSNYDSTLTYKIASCVNESNYYVLSNDCGILRKIERGTDHHKSVIIAMDSFQRGHPSKLNIIDRPAHLRISMTEIDK